MPPCDQYLFYTAKDCIASMSVFQSGEIKVRNAAMPWFWQRFCTVSGFRKRLNKGVALKLNRLFLEDPQLLSIFPHHE